MMFSKMVQNLFTMLLHPSECADDIGLGTDMPSVVRAHALRLVAEQSATSELLAPLRFHQAA
jgi:hypothetical protein